MLSREEVARRILSLAPGAARDQAAALALRLYGPAGQERGARDQAARKPAERRKYAGDPWAYFRDILGIGLAPQQDEALEILERETRVLFPSGNNLGKTFLLGGHAIYTFDAVAAWPDEEAGLEEQGARILLPGPDAATVYATIYSEMLALAARAEARGHMMPGERSEKSVLWRVRAQWEVEAFHPPVRVQQDVAHTASGRHHRNQNAYIEEGQGVPPGVWKGAEGMCSSAGNKIASSFNPTETVGPAYERATGSTYVVYHLDAFKHPNILQRAPVIPAAVDHLVIDGRVRDQCRDRGRYPDVKPDPAFDDFLYALPVRGTPECGGRTDGVLGHPMAEIRVYRPSPTFVAQVRGQYPKVGGGGLFDAGAWDAGVERWRRGPDPDVRIVPPDRVGADPAREGSDDGLGAPSWGLDAGAMLRRYLEAEESLDRLAELRATSRIRVGELQVLVKGDGPTQANDLVSRFGLVPYVMDLGSVGTSPHDYARTVLGADVAGVWFSEAAPEPVRVEWEPWFDNIRASLYWRFARLVNLGLIDVPDDKQLREEVMAHELKPSSRVVEFEDPRTGEKVKKRVQSWLLLEKDAVKRRIGRSPDRSDAVALSLYAPPAPPTPPAVAAIGVGSSLSWSV